MLLLHFPTTEASWNMLVAIGINNNSLTNLSFLKNTPNLERLEADANPIQSLKDLEYALNLKQLSYGEHRFEDFGSTGARKLCQSHRVKPQ